MSNALQIRGEVLDVKRAGSYFVISLTAPGIPEITRPGHFLNIGIGGEESSMLLRRSFAIHQVQMRGMYGGTLDIVVGVNGQPVTYEVPMVNLLKQLPRGARVDLAVLRAGRTITVQLTPEE